MCCRTRHQKRSSNRSFFVLFLYDLFKYKAYWSFLYIFKISVCAKGFNFLLQLESFKWKIFMTLYAHDIFDHQQSSRFGLKQLVNLRFIPQKGKLYHRLFFFFKSYLILQFGHVNVWVIVEITYTTHFACCSNTLAKFWHLPLVQSQLWLASVFLLRLMDLWNR